MNNIHDYYRLPGVITEIKKYSDFIHWLTNDIRAIYQVVQSIIVHDSWLGAYGIDSNKRHFRNVNITYTEDILDKAVELDEIAELCLDADASFNQIKDTYESNKDLQVPEEIIGRQ